MSKAARRRRFLLWKKYWRQCVEVTGQQVPFTYAMGNAWVKAVYRIREGKFWAMPLWHNNKAAPYGGWEYRKWRKNVG